MRKQMQIADVCALILLMIVGSTRCAGQAERQPATGAFPMLKGTYWIYRGSIEEDLEKDGEPWSKITKFHLKMEVVDSVKRGHYEVALLLGYPSDLPAGFGSEGERSCNFWIAVDDKEFYLSDCSRQKERPSRVVLTDKEISARIREDDLIFKLPLKKGDSFGGDPEDRKEGQSGYQWLVSEVRPLTKVKIPGISNAASRTEYVLEFNTLSDHLVANYVPGVGVTRYVTWNGGSAPERVTVDLVEFKSPRPR